MKYSGHRKLLCELSKLSKLNPFILLGYQRNTDASILVYKHCPARIGFNMYAENTQQQLTFLTLLPRFFQYLVLSNRKQEQYFYKMSIESLHFQSKLTKQSNYYSEMLIIIEDQILSLRRQFICLTLEERGRGKYCT